ncbi:MAG: formylglycine-generating enzyme family protein [Deltaproteobacteria bacterium]|jgi:formylglycine-generating enzyme required for sulfatase activity|nr:formylglycine-generating enzyme family protein [Deltaproteobacteria bacterium]
MLKKILFQILLLTLASTLYADDIGEAPLGQERSRSLSKTQANTSSKNYVNSIGMNFVLVKAGSFLMGAGVFDKDVFDHELPQHKVTISKPIYVGATEVTQAQWQELMGTNPSHFINPLNPVEQVSFQDAESFIEKLNLKEGTKAYRLPTEAEWEYFARAGTNSPYFFGDADESLSEYAWYQQNSKNQTHPAGSLAANPWGLFDIYGNVAEMLSDWFSLDYYEMSPGIDPTGPESGSERVLRGGSFDNTSFGNRSSYRDHYRPDYRGNIIGFRVIMDVGDGESFARN